MQDSKEKQTDPGSEGVWREKKHPPQREVYVKLKVVDTQPLASV